MNKSKRNGKLKVVKTDNPSIDEKIDEEIAPITKEFTIKEASLKDGLCNYLYEISTGVNKGDTHGVKGSGIILDDLKNAFQKFNVHLAVIDDSFKLSGIEIDDIDTQHNSDIAYNYLVTGFKITGHLDNESIVLIGSKFVSTAGGRISLVTPKIPMDHASSYKWYNELKAAADQARLEVEEYKAGKFTVTEENKEDELDQPGLFDAKGEDDELNDTEE